MANVVILFGILFGFGVVAGVLFIKWRTAPLIWMVDDHITDLLAMAKTFDSYGMDNVAEECREAARLLRSSCLRIGRPWYDAMHGAGIYRFHMLRDAVRSNFEERGA